MANSDFDLTRTQIITAALRKLGAIASGATPDSNQLSDGADALNMMVKAWQNIGVRLWTVEWVNQTMTSGTSTYSPDPVLDIQRAFVRRNNNDYLVEVIGMQQYFDIPDKTDTGLCQKIAFNADRSSPEIYTWPIPDNSTDVLHYLQVRKLQDFDAASDKPDSPSRWISALVWGLAAELSPEYGILLDKHDRLISKATVELELAIKGERSMQKTEDFVRSAY